METKIIEELYSKYAKEIAKFFENVYSKTDQIDQFDERDWDDLAYGYFLALDINHVEASEIALFFVELMELHSKKIKNE